MNGRIEAFAARLIGDATCDLERPDAHAHGDLHVAALGRRAEELVEHFEPTQAGFGAELRSLQSDLAETGALVWMASAVLGVPTIGWRHERRALEFVVRAVCLRGWGLARRERSVAPPLRTTGLELRDLPDLATDAASPRAEALALGLGFWLDRHATAGARTVRFSRWGGDLVVRCERGGDPCQELSCLQFGGELGPHGPEAVGFERRASTRTGAWIRLSCAPRHRQPTNGAPAAS